MRTPLLAAAACLLAALPAIAAPAPGAKPRPGASEEVVRCAEGEAREHLAAGRATQREKGEGGADEAIALYEKALAADPACASALWELGWSHQAKGEWDAVVATWDRLRAMDPKYPELDDHYPAALRQKEGMAKLKAMPDPGKLPAPDEEPAPGEVLRIAAVGDVTLGRAWPPERAKLPADPAPVIAELRPWLEKADITFGNLETVLADGGDSSKCGPRSTQCYAFRVPTSYAKMLKDTGFDVMSIANNHAGDFGLPGRKSTMAALDAAGIRHSGPIGDIASWEVKGRKVALIAFSFGSDVYRIQELDLGRRVVADLAKKHDLVIVSFHAGAEGKGADHVPKGVERAFGENRGDSRAFARAMVDAGADLLIGHGPHVLRAMELYRGRLIAYSLGNFSSWETFNVKGPGGVSAVLQVALAPNGVATEVEVVPALLESPGRTFPDPGGRAIERIRGLSAEDFGQALLDERGRWARSAPRVSQP